MTLKISGTTITIQNPDGTTKFTSDNKLVYKRGTANGTATLGGSYGRNVQISLPFAFEPAKDFALIYVKITAGNGNVTQQVLNSNIQLNFPFLMQFTHSTTAVQITGWDVLTGMVRPTATGSFIEFSASSLTNGYSATQVNGTVLPIYEVLTTAATYVSFDWKLVVLSYR